MALPAAVFMQGQGTKKIPQQGPTAIWLLPIGIGTFAFTGKVDLFFLGSGTAVVKGSLFPLGNQLINTETVGESNSVTLKADEVGQIVFHGTIATNAPTTVELRCSVTLEGDSTGNVVVSGGKISAYQCLNPDSLIIERPFVA